MASLPYSTGSAPATGNSQGAQNSLLAIAAHKRTRDRENLNPVASQPFLICRREPCMAHLLAFAQPHARIPKYSAEWVAPAAPCIIVNTEVATIIEHIGKNKTSMLRMPQQSYRRKGA